MDIIIAPSMLASDQGRFAEEALAVEKAGADWLHIDVMDGQFVPPITFGAGVVSALKKVSRLPLDVHLMIEQPERQVNSFFEAGAQTITVHQEACPHLHRVLQSIKALGISAGVAINPSTPVSTLSAVVDLLDLILVMTVNPGWGGQSFIGSCETKIREAANLITDSGRNIRLEVDGGIDPQTAAKCIGAGADTLVAGSAVFGTKHYQANIQALRG